MRHRDLLSIKAHREEIEAEQRAERERIEAPIRAAESQFKDTTRKLALVMQERLLGKVLDPDRIAVDPSVASVRMSKENANKFNRSEFVKFRTDNPDIFWTHELIDNLGAYFDANGLRIVTASMIGALIERYREAALLPDPPEPELAPEPEPITEPVKTIEPEVFEGWDMASGEPRTYTRREVDHMSADEYRRAFRIYREHLALPTVGPGARLPA